MPVNKLSVRGLLPDTDYYMTYDGSTTAPACFETVTWIIINKPIYITKQQVSIVFHIMAFQIVLYLFSSMDIVKGD
jgi:carbonic anhydrase